MPISVTCPECDTTYRVADEAAGKAIKCKKCGARVPVPAADDRTGVRAGTPERSAGRSDNGDTDDGEARPKKQGGSRKLVVIIAGALVGVCCICSGIGGGIYWGVNYAIDKGKDALAQGKKQFQQEMDKAVQEMEKAQREAMEKAQKKDATKGIAKDKAPAVGGNVVFEKKDTLTKKDPMFKDTEFGDPKPLKTYRVKLEAGKQYVIDMKHQGNGDPYLILLDPQGKEAARDDDSGGLLDAQVRYRPTVTGEYTIRATVLSDLSLGPAGMNFTLTVRRE